jgi:Terminase RNaseH-like domain
VFKFGKGSREDLVQLGTAMDESEDNALALTPMVLNIRNRLGQNVALAANQAQEQYTRAAKGKRRNIVLKARQMGITSWIAAQFFLQTITHPGTVTVQVAHTQEAAEQIFRIVHRFLANLPEALREGSVLKSARVSSRRLVIPEMDSEYLVETAGDRNAGRGLTVTNLHCTELARWPGDAAETLYGLLASLSPAGVLAMESTPQGASGCFWNEWKSAERTGTAKHFFPWWMEAAYTTDPVSGESLTEEEKALMTKFGLNLGQIGYRRQIRENFRGLAMQEYAEDADECFLASGSCYFEVPAIDRRLADVTEPVEKRLRGELHVWFHPLPDREYLVSVDPAGGGTGGDFTAIEVIDRTTCLQCAELQAHLTTLETAHEAAKLAREYNHALVVVERNSLGSSVLAYLGTTERYHNVYEHEDGQAGFLTSSVTRPLMLSQLASVLVTEPKRFTSERLLRECRSFVRLENGRTEAQAGEHDDLVLAMAIAFAARENQLDPRAVR